MSTSGTHLAVVVLADAGTWAAWSAVVGYAAHRLPPGAVERDGWLTRARRWEDGGRWYERIGIRRWKDRLPEAGAVFRGGTSKRALPGRSTDGLRRFAAETRRAELVHWAIPVITPVFVLWNPPALLAAMATYAVVANAPCIAVQRYNRARITRVLTRRGAPGPRRGATR
jgi:glycosyl-4,4'-diaponeurosporenoate acyltransferase